jgi:Lipase (class 3)
VTPQETASLAVRLGLPMKQLYAGFASSTGLPDGLTLIDAIHGNDADGSEQLFGSVMTDEAGALHVSIRGTQTPLEWLADFEAWLVEYQASRFPKTCVERGFWTLYKTFHLASGKNLIETLSAFPVKYIAGHSLGGPLATYLAVDIKADQLIGLASPKPGNMEFCAWAITQTKQITLYTNKPDVVPHAPLTIPGLSEFDFEHVAALTPLDSKGLVKPGLAAAHNISTYLHLLDPSQPLDPAFVP